MPVHIWAVAEAAARKHHIDGRSEAAGYAAGIMTWVIAWAILGEGIEWYHYLGGGFVIVGILLVTLMRPKPPARF